MRYRYLWEPGTTFYRSRRIKLSPEGKAALRRRLAAAEAYRRARFPDYYREKDKA
jgi:hypothetical protein